MTLEGSDVANRQSFNDDERSMI